MGTGEVYGKNMTTFDELGLIELNSLDSCKELTNILTNNESIIFEKLS